MPIRSFINLVGARSSLPGGGCVSALVASLGSSLACMSSYLTYGNRKFEKFDPQIREVLPVFHNAYNELMDLIDQDAIAFNSYVVSENYEFFNHCCKIEIRQLFKRTQEECRIKTKERN